MDQMRRRLAKKGPATKRTDEEKNESEQEKKKLKFNPMLQPKESAQEKQDAEMAVGSNPASGSTEGVGQKREREEGQ